MHQQTLDHVWNVCTLYPQLSKTTMILGHLDGYASLTIT